MKIYNASEYSGLDKSKFTLVQMDTVLHDQKFETKPVGFFKDAMQRFKKNKSSVSLLSSSSSLRCLPFLAPWSAARALTIRTLIT